MLIEIKQNVKEAKGLLSHCIWKPTDEKINEIISKYFSGDNMRLFLLSDSSGLIGIRDAGKKIIEICHIAVSADKRKKGTGRLLIQEIIDYTNCIKIFAETDDDAVEFYRKCGFKIKSLGEKYQGIVRYYCEMNCGGKSNID